MADQNQQNQQNKIIEIAVRQNLLLWQISSSLLDVKKELVEQNKKLSEIVKEE